MDFVHKSPTGGHMGFKRTYKRCRESFWWLDMSREIKMYVKLCEQCGKNKHETHPNVAPLQLMDIPVKVFDKLQIDFLGPFQSTTAHDYRYALQIQDILSCYLLLIPTEADDAKTAAKVLFEDWLCRFGPPKIIQSDRGSHFASQVFGEMCKLAGVKHVMGAPGHPEAQGQVERQNQLMNQVRCLAQNKPDCWPQAILRVAYAHNISENETTGLSPFKIVFANEPRTLEGVFLSTSLESRDMGNTSVETEVDKLQQYHDSLLAAKERLQSEARKMTIAAQKERSEKCFRKGQPYKVGDRVRIKLGVAERGKLGGKKLAPLYSDVYMVKEVKGAGWTYLLVAENGVGRDKIRHYNNLKEVAHKEEQLEMDLDSTPGDDVIVEIGFREKEGLVFQKK